MNIELFFNKIILEIELPLDSEDELIRIEKQLLLELKLNQKFEIKDIEEIIKIINDFPLELLYLLREKNLTNFLLAKNQKYKSATLFEYESDAKNFELFFRKYLIGNFKDSLNLYLVKEIYNPIYFLSYYTDILPIEFIEYLESKFIEKLEIGFQLLDSDIDFNLIKNKIDYLGNKDFLDLFSVFTSYEIEDKISKLITLFHNQIVSGKYKNRLEFIYKFYFYLGSYNCLDENLQSVIFNNHRFAYTMQPNTIKEMKIANFIGKVLYAISSIFILFIFYKLFTQD